MEELYRRILRHVVHETFRFLIEMVHLLAELVLLGEHVGPDLVESVVIDLEYLLDLELVIVKLFHERFFLLHVQLFEIDKLLLQVVANR